MLPYIIPYFTEFNLDHSSRTSTANVILQTLQICIRFGCALDNRHHLRTSICFHLAPGLGHQLYILVDMEFPKMVVPWNASRTLQRSFCNIALDHSKSRRGTKASFTHFGTSCLQDGSKPGSGEEVLQGHVTWEFDFWSPYVDRTLYELTNTFKKSYTSCRVRGCGKALDFRQGSLGCRVCLGGSGAYGAGFYKGTLLGSPNREPQEYSRYIIGI